MGSGKLTVKLKDGQTYYFDAGSVVGEPLNRIDMLRYAIENGTDFRSVDQSGVEVVGLTVLELDGELS